jgi:outer membrane protein assembly factor BamB
MKFMPPFFHPPFMTFLRLQFGAWAAALGMAGPILPAELDTPAALAIPAPGLVWRIATTEQDDFLALAAGHEGIIYASSHKFSDDFWTPPDGFLRAISPDGLILWTREFPQTRITGPSVGLDGTVYIGGSDGTVYAVSPDNEVKWEFAAGNPVVISLAIGKDGTIYFCANSGNSSEIPSSTYAVNPQGQLSWRFSNAPPFTSHDISWAPVVREDGTVMAAGPNSIRMIRPDGQLLWERTHPGADLRGGIGLGQDGSIFFGTSPGWNAGSLHRLNSDGSAFWAQAGEDYLSAPLIGPDGAVYIATRDKKWLAVSSSGDPLWSFEADGLAGGGGALDAEGTIYFGTDSGTVYALDQEGVDLWRFETEAPVQAAPLILSSGGLLVGTQGGLLWRLEGTAPPAEGLWPHPRGDSQRAGLSKEPYTQPAAPAGLVKTSGDCDIMIRFNWESSPGALEYQVWRSTTPELQDAVQLSGSVAVQLTWQDTEAGFGREYFYWVRAVNPAGESPWSGPITGMQTRKLWEYNSGDVLGSVVADASGAVFLSIRRGNPDNPWVPGFFAVKLDPDGQLLWEKPLAGSPGSPTLDGRRQAVYFPVQSGATLVTALNLEGELLWETSLGQEGAINPVAVDGDGRIYGQADRSLFCISPDGEVLWRSNCARPPNSNNSPVVGPGNEIYTPTRNGLSAYYGDGRLKWTAGPVSHFQPALGRDGTVYSSMITRARAYHPNGTLKWEHDMPGSFLPLHAPAIKADGTVLFPHSRALIAIAPDGMIQWRFEMFVDYGPLLTEDGLIHFVAAPMPVDPHRLVTLTANGEFVCETLLPSKVVSPPVLREDGVALLSLSIPDRRTLDGALHAILLPGRLAQGGWPMPRLNPAGTGSLAPPNPIPAAPQNFKVIPFLGRLRLDWTPAGEFVIHEIWRGATPETMAPIAEIGPTNRFDDLDVAPGEHYYYQVRARNGAGEGPFAGSPAAALPSAAEHLWEAQAPDSPAHLALGFDGTIYLRGFYGPLVAFDPDGELKWEQELDAEPQESVVIGADGTVYLSTHKGLRAFTPEGEEKWVAEPEIPFSSGPAIGADGTLYAIEYSVSGSGNLPDTLSAYSPEGEVIWKTKVANHLVGPVVTMNRTILVAALNRLFSVRSDGEVEWDLDFPEHLSGIGLGLEGEIILTADKELLVLSSTGETLQAFSLAENFRDLLVGPDGAIYGVSARQAQAAPHLWPITMAGTLQVFEREGSTRSIASFEETPPLQGPRLLALTADGGFIVVWGKTISSFSPAGEIRWGFDAQGPISHLTLGLDGRLYFLAETILHAIQTDSAPAAGWSMNRGHPRRTASLDRMAPPAVTIVSHEAEFTFSVNAQENQAFTILGSRDLKDWRIIGSGAGPQTLSIPEWRAAHPPIGFIRTATP